MEKIIKTRAEVNKFLNELEIMKNGEDVRELIEARQYEYIVKLGEKSFAIVFDENYDCDNARIGYIRVSTEEQAENGNGVSIYLDELFGYRTMKRYNLCAIAFDLGISGDNKKDLMKALDEVVFKDVFKDIRPGLHFALSHLTESNKILTADHNRLWRENDLTGALIRTIIFKRDSDLELINMPTVTLYEREPALYLTMMMQFNIAEFEKRTIVKRTYNGRKKKGLSPKKGCSRLKYGYTTDKDDYIIINEEEAKNVRKVYELYKQTGSPTETANMMNALEMYRGDELWTVSEVEKIIRPRGLHTYNGYRTFGNEEEFYEDLVIIPASMCQAI